MVQVSFVRGFHIDIVFETDVCVLILTTELNTVCIWFHTQKETPKQYVHWIGFYTHGNWLVCYSGG